MATRANPHGLLVEILRVGQIAPVGRVGGDVEVYQGGGLHSQRLEAPALLGLGAQQLVAGALLLVVAGGIAAQPCANIDMTFTGTVGLFVDAGFAGKQLTKAVEKSGQSLSHKIYDVNRQAQTCGLK